MTWKVEANSHQGWDENIKCSKKTVGLPIFHPRYLTKIKESNTRPTVQGLLNQSELARQTAAWNHCQPLSKCIGVWVLQNQRACPQENHPDVAGLRFRLPPLFCFPTFLAFFIPLTSSILSPSFYISVFLLSSPLLISPWRSSSFSRCLSSVPKSFFTSSPPSPFPSLVLSVSVFTLSGPSA